MRRSDREITDPGEIGAILSGAQVCRIALAGENGPYVVPLCFGYEPGALYLHSAPEGTKIDMIHNDPRVCFEADICDGVVKNGRACSWGMRYRSVIGFGLASILSDPDEKRHGLSCIMRQYDSGSHVFSDNEIGTVAVIKIAITSVTAKKRE